MRFSRAARRGSRVDAGESFRPRRAPTPRVAPKGTSDDELLVAADWQLDGFPAISRDGRHVATLRPPPSYHLRSPTRPADDDPTVSGGVAITLGERGSGDELDVVIVHVADGSEAERAGLATGDVVLAVDGRDVVDMRDARARLSGSIKTDVVVEVDRGGGSAQLRVSREQVRR